MSLLHEHVIEQVFDDPTLGDYLQYKQLFVVNFGHSISLYLESTTELRGIIFNRLHKVRTEDQPPNIQANTIGKCPPIQCQMTVLSLGTYPPIE